MKKLLTLILALLMLASQTAVFAASKDIPLPELHAKINDEANILFRIPIGTETGDIKGDCRYCEQPAAACGFTMADDGTLFVLNDNTVEQAVKVYSKSGEHLYDISCDELASPEQEQWDNYCPIKDIQYHDGNLYAVAYYNNEMPALIKYSIADKSINKMRFPKSFLESLESYAVFEGMFEMSGSIVIGCTGEKYLTYSTSNDAFDEVPSFNATRDESTGLFTVAFGGETYTMDESNYFYVLPLGMDKDANMYFSTIALAHCIGGVKLLDKEGKLVGGSYSPVRDTVSGYFPSEVAGGDIYRMFEDSDYLYLLKLDMNKDYIATGMYDIDGNGECNTADAVYMLKMIGGLISDYDHTKCVLKADANRDGVFNTGDAVKILKVCADM